MKKIFLNLLLLLSFISCKRTINEQPKSILVYCNRYENNCLKDSMFIEDFEEKEFILRALHEKERKMFKIYMPYRVKLIYSDSISESILINKNMLKIKGLTYKTKYDIGDFISKKLSCSENK